VGSNHPTRSIFSCCITTASIQTCFSLSLDNIASKIWEQNLRQPLAEGERRHEWKTTHSFRKFFETHAMSVMKPLNVALLISHDTGITESYWRPTEKEVLADYLKAVGLLTINKSTKTTSKLQKQVTQLILSVALSSELGLCKLIGTYESFLSL
jgi:hypothetical protein